MSPLIDRQIDRALMAKRIGQRLARQALLDLRDARAEVLALRERKQARIDRERRAQKARDDRMW